MGARLRVFLTCEQDQTLFSLRTEDLRKKVKDRAEVISLNVHEWDVTKITVHFRWTARTVREVLHRWQRLGMEISHLVARSRRKNRACIFLSA